MYFGDPARQHTKDPAVVRFDGRYWMYYSRVGGDRLGIGVATSEDLEHWRVVGALGHEGEWEQYGIAAPAAIVLNGAIQLFCTHVTADADGYVMFHSPAMGPASAGQEPTNHRTTGGRHVHRHTRSRAEDPWCDARKPAQFRVPGAAHGQTRRRGH
jgi:sucrose-6-phosphate hydrolase SacC (GH32 family)